MLILTIILAAFAPLMTKRKNVDLSSSPWKYALNNSDIYYGLGNSQTAMIGQNEKASGETSSRLTLNTSSDTQSHILFKKGTSELGQLKLGSNSVILGSTSTSTPSGGGNTIALGIDNLTSNTGYENVAIGYTALRNNSTGSNNIAIGSEALSTNTTAYANVAIGTRALSKNNTGTHNTAIGFEACNNVTGSSKTCIGSYSGPSYGVTTASDDTNMVFIGTSSSNVYIPGNLVVGGSAYFNADDSNARVFMRLEGYSDKVRVMGSREANGHPHMLQAWDTDVQAVYGVISDRRLKNVGKPYTSGLEELRYLPLYNFTFKKDKDKTPQVGVMAQDLQKIFPDAVTKDEDGYLRIRWDDMFYAVINSVKQLDLLVHGIIGELKTAVIKISTHDDEIKRLQKENAELKARIEKLEKAVF